MHRIFESGSDRASLKWDDDFKLRDAEDFGLHHLYRAMGFLGRPLENQQKKCQSMQISEIQGDALLMYSESIARTVDAFDNDKTQLKL
jgi:hypothetical protein